MNKLLSITAILISLGAVFYAEFNRVNHISAETVVCNECIELSNAVEELRVEINHLHEVDIEIGDNLNKRIDELQTGVAAVKEDAVNAAKKASEAAAARAESAANKTQMLYEKVKAHTDAALSTIQKLIDKAKFWK